MCSNLRSLGKRFEQKGDYSRAFAAYLGAGQKTDVNRVHSIMKIIDFAKWAQKNHFYRRACDLLVDNGLKTEAEKMLSTVSGRGLDALYAKARLLADAGNIKESQKNLEELARFGYKGLYLAGLVMVDVFPENAKRVANSLSGIQIEMPEPSDEEKEQKLLISGTDPSKMARDMSSMLFFHMSSETEGYYYALRIYKKLGLDEECARCLSKLKEKNDDKYFLFGSITMQGTDNLNESGHSFSAYTRLIAAIACGMTDQVIESIGKGYYEERHGERYQLFFEILCEIEDYLPEFADFESLRSIQCAMLSARAEVTKTEEAKLAEIEKLLEKGDLLSLQVARIKAGEVKFTYTETDYTECLLRIADHAVTDSSTGAQKLAGEIYQDRAKYDRAIPCARSLLEAGEIDDAKSLFSRIGNGLSYASKREEVDKLAGDLEEQWPRVSLELYKASLNNEGIMRTAKRLLETDQINEVAEAAWGISLADKKSIEMRNALLQLESFGENGKDLAQGIRLEMRVPAVFVAK